MATVILISLLSLASAAPHTVDAESPFTPFLKKFHELQAQKEHIVPMPMHVIDECGAPADLHIKPEAAALLQQDNVPGAGIDGMDDFKPFKTVLKDGFLLVDCVRDYMYERGDKFGDNKHDYKLGPVSGVSIVHYDAFVAKEDRAEMTQKKCFEFCRTVPNMGYFGIVNGRGCYCTPYFKPMASDSTQCDAVCEGDNTLMCGGKSKSSIFAMHMCDSTEEDLSTRSGTAKMMKDGLETESSKAADLSKSMQGTADKMQKSFGAVGDSGATGHMQEAKVFAGDLEHGAEDGNVVADKLGKLIKQGSGLKDFKTAETVTKAERIMEGIDETVAEAEVEGKKLTNLVAMATGQGITTEEDPTKAADAQEDGFVWTQKFKDEFKGYCGGGDRQAAARCLQAFALPWDEIVAGEPVQEKSILAMKNFGIFGAATSAKWIEESKAKKEEDKSAIDQYYPVMYFVDKEFENVPTTCTGDRVGRPIVGKNEWDCAVACDANIHSCVGFQYFEDGDDKLCFLLSGFSTGFYYTGCGKSFLQTSKAPFSAKCYAKLSKFEGTTLKPNPSGKCAQCFKDLTKADRCYK